VYRTGRVPKIASQIGSMLNVRPMLTSSGGLIRFKGAVRNREQGKSRLLEVLKDKVGRSPVHVAVMHAFAPEEAEKLKERVSSEFNCSELFITEFSPVMGYATGTGTLGLAFYKS
jgi:DegV family protein with EDD domain